VEKPRKVIKAKVLKEMESLNVEIPNKREKIRNYYLEMMRVKRDEYNQKDLNFDEDEKADI
jgi:hypothetical protein